MNSVDNTFLDAIAALSFTAKAQPQCRAAAAVAAVMGCLD